MLRENPNFKFTETNSQSQNLEFKKERAAYLAQRNARKKEAEMVMKRQRGHSSSSDDDPPPIKKEGQALKFQHQEDKKTDSSKDSKKEEEHDQFHIERERYKAERAARRHEVARNKQVEFGPSSSSDGDSIPIYKPRLNVIQSSSKKEKIKSEKNVSSKEQLGTNPFFTLDVMRGQKQKGHNMHSSVRLKMNLAEKKPHRQRFQIEVPSKKGVNIWLQQFLQFKQNSVEIGERSVVLYDITKIKLFFIRTLNGNYKLKVTCKDEDIFFAVDHKKLNELCLDHYYYLFAKIVTLKLQIMGKKPCHQERPKISLNEHQLKGAQITGKVRKSSFFGGWQQSAGVVNQSGLCIYKEGKQKPSFVIGYNTIRELWTRFDFDNQNLIVKFLHNSSKVELSIPFENYLSRDNWLYHIYNLAYK